MHKRRVRVTDSKVQPKMNPYPSPGSGNRAARTYSAVALRGDCDAASTDRTGPRTSTASRFPSRSLQANEPGWLESIAVGGENIAPGTAGKAVEQGAALSPEVRAPLERQFGASFSGIRIHEDGVAQASDALAVAEGNDIHFAPGQFQPKTEPGRFLLGHELAHVVQQRRGGTGAQCKRISVDVGAADHGLEAEADRIGARIAAGESVAGQIQGRAPRGRPQRFGAKEHREMGKKGSKGSMVQLADDYTIPFGDMVALAGDHFESIDQVREFASNNSGGAESRDEIEFAREWKLGHEGVYKNKSDAEAAQKNRYYTLAGQNDVHFPNPNAASPGRSTAEKALETTTRVRLEGFQWKPYQGPSNAIAAYRMNHVRAIAEAAQAGANHQPIESALATDGFGCHFLTDSFSSGHVRAQRTDARAYWNAKVPMFFLNLKGFIAESVAKKLQESGKDSPYEVDYDHMPQQLVFVETYKKVKSAMESMGVVNFGDIVGLALHDWDNDIGILATVQGERVPLMGDGNAGQGDEQVLAIRAVSASVDDIHSAYALGITGNVEDAPMQLLGIDGLYAPERLIPEAVPDDQLSGQDPTKSEGNRSIKWDYPDVATLMTQPDFQRAVTVFCRAKADEVRRVGEKFDETQRWALIESVVSPLKSDPVGSLWKVIHWTPDIAHGTFGKADDNAEEYVRAATKTKGGMASLTSTQRINLIVDLLKGWQVADSEEEKILDLLVTASDADARRVIKWIGWGDLAEALEGAEDTRFRSRFPREQYGR